MSLSPAQARFIANVEPFRTQLAQIVRAINASLPEMQKLAKALDGLREYGRRAEMRRIHVQYRRKSRGHR